MVVQILMVVGIVELVSHVLGYSSSATVKLLRIVLANANDVVQTVLTKVNDVVQAVLTKK